MLLVIGTVVVTVAVTLMMVVNRDGGAQKSSNDTTVVTCRDDRIQKPRNDIYEILCCNSSIETWSPFWRLSYIREDEIRWVYGCTGWDLEGVWSLPPGISSASCLVTGGEPYVPEFQTCLHLLQPPRWGEHFVSIVCAMFDSYTNTTESIRGWTYKPSRGISPGWYEEDQDSARMPIVNPAKPNN